MTTAKKNPKKTVPKVKSAEAPRAEFRSREERLVAGRALRDHLPRKIHAKWEPSPKRRDPIDVLEESNRDRLPELVPIRYGRMLRSPFAFLRGSAGLMAYDLATTPNTKIQVQACGDCHLVNFGLFATPERNLVFDINDFDETLPAPWEWDIKRLGTSVAVAARNAGHSDDDARATVIECARAYRERLRDYSRKSPLEVWYARLDAQTLIDIAPDAKTRKRRQEMVESARQRIGEFLFPKITTVVGGRPRLVDQPPLLFHITEEGQEQRVREAMEDYRQSLPDDRRVLFDRYRLEDIALKVVGIGSVGTRCFVGLFFSPENHPLLLQFKEASTSVLAPYAGKSRYDNQGERVVVGQRLMQSASDIFLGWLRSRRGIDYFARQLRDMKFSFPLDDMSPVQLKHYSEVCGWTLARAHAKSGDAATISGYLGKSDTFDQALGEFSLAYADQTVRDHAALVAAVKAGRIEALVEENL
jgi:uncharacterized protein (DUF2252 family)